MILHAAARKSTTKICAWASKPGYCIFYTPNKVLQFFHVAYTKIHEGHFPYNNLLLFHQILLFWTLLVYVYFLPSGEHATLKLLSPLYSVQLPNAKVNWYFQSYMYTTSQLYLHPAFLSYYDLTSFKRLVSANVIGHV